jgi:hypothetical protein
MTADDILASASFVDGIIDDIVTRIGVQTACDVHQAYKTGKLPRGAPKNRLELYPSIHKDEESMQESLNKYATEEPLKKRSRFLTEDFDIDPDDETKQDGDSEQEGTAGGAGVGGGTGIVTRHQQSNIDIWGRMPRKELLAKCSLCDRAVSVQRFAPHLDKCMNLGTVRGAATNANSSTLSRSNSSNPK